MIASAARTLRLCIVALYRGIHCRLPRIRTPINRAALVATVVPVRARCHRSPCTSRALTRTDRPGHSGSHLPWLTPQTDLVPDKGQFRLAFPPIRSATVVRQRFFGIFWPLFLAGSERLRDKHRMTDTAHNQHSETRRPSDRDHIVTIGPSRFQPARPEVLR